MEWRAAMIETFGRCVVKKLWWSAAMDIHLVDIGVKAACLFDHWSVEPEEMCGLLCSLTRKGVLTGRVKCVAVGQDVLVCSTSPELCPTHLSSGLDTACYIDITSNLSAPELLSCKDNIDCRLSASLQVVSAVWGKIVSVSESRDIETSQTFHTLDLAPDGFIDVVNVPCVFGLMIGYPCVYWYDMKISQDNCLTGLSLQLFQVKGLLIKPNTESPNLTQSSHLLSCKPESKHNAARGCKKADRSSTSVRKIGLVNSSAELCENTSGERVPDAGDSFIVLSFTVPSDLCESDLEGRLCCWFNSWKTARQANWSVVFSQLWMEQSTVQPDFVVL